MGYEAGRTQNEKRLDKANLLRLTVALHSTESGEVTSAQHTHTPETATEYEQPHYDPFTAIKQAIGKAVSTR